MKGIRVERKMSILVLLVLFRNFSILYLVYKIFINPFLMSANSIIYVYTYDIGLHCCSCIPGLSSKCIVGICVSSRSFLTLSPSSFGSLVS